MTPRIARSVRPSSVPEGLSALVADRSPHARALIAEALKRAGISRSRHVADGAEAVEMIGSGRYDILVIDWDLAVIPAPEVLRLARGAADRDDLPVVVTMTQPKRSTVEAAKAEGVTSVLAKPLSAARLRERIETALAAP